MQIFKEKVETNNRKRKKPVLYIPVEQKLFIVGEIMHLLFLTVTTRDSNHKEDHKKQLLELIKKL